MLVFSADDGGTFESRIDALNSTSVEDMVRVYFAKADEVGLLLFCAINIFIQFNVCSY